MKEVYNMENCQNYQYEIPLTMARTSGAKYLNDQILAGRNKGYSDFLLKIKNSKTYSNVCAPIAGILDYYRNLGCDFEIQYEDAQSYVAHTRFEKPEDAGSTIDKSDLQYPFDKVWTFRTSEGVNALVNAYILAIRQADIISPGVIQSLEWCLNETLDNTLQHSGIEHGYIMVQLHKTVKQLSVCVFDAGIGIYNSLKSSKYHPETPLDAITLALQEKVTRDDTIGQGNGLWGFSKLISNAEGRFEVSSNGAVYYKDNENVRTTLSGHLNLGKKYGTTLIDFQLNYSHEIDVARALNGYQPVDLWLEDLEADNGEIVILVSEKSSGTGTRKSAEKLRTMIMNITLADKKKVILDFTGVHLLSSSFSDELIGKIISQYGFVFFINHFSIINLDAFNASILNRSVQQRMAQTYYDSTIEDAKDI